MIVKKRTKPLIGRTSISGPKTLLLIPAIALVIKCFIAFRIEGLDWLTAGNQDLGNGLQKLLDTGFVPPNIWFGSDGENYVRALLGLIQEGIFSQARNLYYWPAGYPILIWGLLFVFKGNLFIALSIFQSLFYAGACLYFVQQVRTTRLHRLVYPMALILAFNPTLTLSSIVVGYESLAASCVILAIALMISYSKSLEKSIFDLRILSAASAISFASFLQPRIIALAVVFFLFWGLAYFKGKALVVFLLLTLSISLFSSASLASRNYKSMDFFAVSTNLGVTMNIGAGVGSSGGYSNNPVGVQCPGLEGNIAEQDNARVKCVLKWYVNNPTESIRLFWNKSTFFWSPWFGPLANGTMGRNPWLEVHPLKDAIRTQSGFDMVAGSLGKAVSWGWISGNVILLFLGWRILWNLGGVQRLWGTSALAMVLTNWLVSLVTIGDHRFRIPTMTLSLTLQVVALFRYRLRVGKLKPLHGESVPWPIFHWKRKQENDNLSP